MVNIPYPIGSMVLVYMLTLGVYWWQMLPYIAYMDPMGTWSIWVMIPLNHSEPAELTANPTSAAGDIFVAAGFFSSEEATRWAVARSVAPILVMFSAVTGISQTWTRWCPHVMFVGGSEPVKTRVWTSSEHYPVTCCGPIFPTARSVL